MSEGRSRDELVTVVIPAFNAERYILEALSSINDQTHRPIEVVVVNDGSTDSTAETVSRFAPDLRADALDVQIVDIGSNKGVANGLYTGFSRAHGDYVCWLSADDAYVKKDKLSLQLEKMKAEGAMWSYYRGILTGPRVPEARKTKPPFPMNLPFIRSAFEKDNLKRLLMLMLRNPINGSSVMISRECLRKYGSFDPSRRNMDADGDLWLRYSALGAKLSVLDGSPVLYRRHGGQDSKKIEAHVFDMELTRRRVLGALERLGHLAPAIDSAFKYLPLIMRPDVYRYRPRTVEHLFGYMASHPELFSGYKRWYASRAVKKLAARTDKIPVDVATFEEALKEYETSPAYLDFCEKLRPVEK